MKPQSMSDIYRRMAANQRDAMLDSLWYAKRISGKEAERYMLYAEGYAADAQDFDRQAAIAES